MNMKKKIVFDVCLAVLLLTLSFTFLFVFEGEKTVGDSVRVRVDGELYGEFSLFENASYALNGGSNVLVIDGGTAYMLYADCPDGVCIRSGKISYIGQRIVCLPNKIIVEIVGDGDGILEV